MDLAAWNCHDLIITQLLGFSKEKITHRVRAGDDQLYFVHLVDHRGIAPESSPGNWVPGPSSRAASRFNPPLRSNPLTKQCSGAIF